jgi:hypothetical protein
MDWPSIYSSVVDKAVLSGERAEVNLLLCVSGLGKPGERGTQNTHTRGIFEASLLWFSEDDMAVEVAWTQGEPQTCGAVDARGEASGCFARSSDEQTSSET